MCRSQLPRPGSDIPQPGGDARKGGREGRADGAGRFLWVLQTMVRLSGLRFTREIYVAGTAGGQSSAAPPAPPAAGSPARPPCPPPAPADTRGTCVALRTLPGPGWPSAPSTPAHSWMRATPVGAGKASFGVTLERGGVWVGDAHPALPAGVWSRQARLPHFPRVRVRAPPAGGGPGQAGAERSGRVRPPHSGHSSARARPPLPAGRPEPPPRSPGSSAAAPLRHAPVSAVRRDPPGTGTPTPAPGTLRPWELPGTGTRTPSTRTPSRNRDPLRHREPPHNGTLPRH